MSITCVQCAQNLPDNALFCSSCGTQTQCKSCNYPLALNAVFCINCGDEIRKNGNSSLNNIKINQDKNSLAIEASLTDFVGGSVAEALLYLAANSGIGPRKQISNTQIQQIKSRAKQPDLFSSAEELKEDEELKALPPPPTTPKKSEQIEESLLSTMFEEENENWILANPNLKAKNKADFFKRLTCLFLQFRHDQGIKPVPRTEINSLVKNASSYDGNYRRWLRDEKTLLNANEKEMKLILPGIEFVKEIIADIQNPEVPSGWKVGTVKKSGRKSSTKKAGTSDSSEEDTE